MALIAVNRNSGTGILPIIEDPVLSNNRLFINTQSYNTTTLTPNWQEQGGFVAAVGAESILYGAVTYYTADSCNMILEKGTVCCYSAVDVGTALNANTLDSYHKALDFAYYPIRKGWKTSNSKVILTTGSTVVDASGYASLVQAWSTNISDFSTGAYYNIGTGVNSFIYEDVANYKLWGFYKSGVFATTTESIMIYNSIDLTTSTSTKISIATYGSTALIGNDVYFMGIDATGWPHFVIVANGTSNYTIIKVNPSTLAVTTVVASTGGGLAEVGAHRRPSNIRRRSDTIRVFYSCHFDASSILAPKRFVWDTVGNTITSTVCTMAYTGADTYATHAAINTTNGYLATDYGQQSWHAKPHQFTLSGTNYITFFLVDKCPSTANGALRWSSTAKRTMITYSIGAGTGDDVLTYHSKYTPASANDMPREFLPITSDGTQLAIPQSGQLYFYNFSAITGWVITGPYALEPHMMGLDQSNRLWASGVEKGTNTLHLITPTMPISITVVMAAQSYSYTGTAISTTAVVNAYNSVGARIVSTVNLSIDGATMLFTSNSTKVLSVTTSASADTTVNLTISGGGINNIVASVSV